MNRVILASATLVILVLIFMRPSYHKEATANAQADRSKDNQERICIVHGSIPNDVPCYFDVAELIETHASHPIAIASVGNMFRRGSVYFLHSVHGESKIRLLVDSATGLKYLDQTNDSPRHVSVYGYVESRDGINVVRVTAIRGVESNLNGPDAIRVPGL